MRLSELMDEKTILLSLKGKKKAEMLEEMVECLSKAGILENKKEFLSSILEREELESTALGGGVAIPHGRSSGVKKLTVLFARDKNGVDFQALDRKPVHYIFMIAAPKDVRKEYLQAIAKVARLLKSELMKKRLMEVNREKELMDTIRDFDRLVPERIEVKTKEGKFVEAQSEYAGGCPTKNCPFPG